MIDTDLVRLAYVSCSHIELAGVQTILATAHRRNPELQITGGLLFTGQYFFQTLEGPGSCVEAMFDRVRADNRHFGISVVIREPVEARRFHAWTMGFASMPVLDQFITPLFANGDADRADILSRMTVQALCHKT
ncbi:MAG: BLUF domain-containing protein [Pseudomonadota bacterium]|nr:BLUF domain-containing protein [Pseudomonadota bacterium]